jgi:hypothetical protein
MQLKFWWKQNGEWGLLRVQRRVYKKWGKMFKDLKIIGFIVKENYSEYLDFKVLIWQCFKVNEWYRWIFN